MQRLGELNSATKTRGPSMEIKSNHQTEKLMTVENTNLRGSWKDESISETLALRDHKLIWIEGRICQKSPKN